MFLLEQKRPFLIKMNVSPNWKIVLDRELSCDMHTQFSKGNIVQNIQGSNLAGFQ
jgi:hypothetical protein